MNAETDTAQATPKADSEVMRSSARINRALWSVALVPLIAMLLFLSLALRARTGGEWPTYNNPDPKDFGFHYTIAVLAFIGAFAAALIVPIGALVAYSAGHRRVQLAPVLFVVGSFVVYFVFLRLNVGGLTEWFAD